MRPTLPGSAIFGPQVSPTGAPLYRYLLTRTLDGTQDPLVIVMVNPSTADAERDDPTITRCMGFARRARARALIVANLYAYRATDVRVLGQVPDPVGPENDAHLRSLAREHRHILVAWGASAKLPARLRPRVAAVVDLLRGDGATLGALAVCADGQPAHPLRLKGSLRGRPWG